MNGLTSRHIQVLAAVLQRAPVTIAEQMVLEEMFVILEAGIMEAPGGTDEEEVDINETS